MYIVRWDGFYSTIYMYNLRDLSTWLCNMISEIRRLMIIPIICKLIWDLKKQYLFWQTEYFDLSFLAHLSWKLKWAFLIAFRPSSVCPSVNFSYFRLLLQNHWANFNQTCHKASLGEGNSSLFKWRAPPFSKGRLLRNSENKLTKFKKSSPEPLSQFQPNLAQSILGWRGFKFVQIKGPALL